MVRLLLLMMVALSCCLLQKPWRSIGKRTVRYPASVKQEFALLAFIPHPGMCSAMLENPHSEKWTQNYEKNDDRNGICEFVIVMLIACTPQRIATEFFGVRSQRLIFLLPMFVTSSKSKCFRPCQDESLRSLYCIETPQSMYPYQHQNHRKVVPIEIKSLWTIFEKFVCVHPLLTMTQPLTLTTQ